MKDNSMINQPLTDGYASLKEANDYDLCFVFNVGNKDKEIKVTEGKKKIAKHVNEFEHFQCCWSIFLGRLEYAKLKFTLYKSQDKDLILCLVRSPSKRLKEEAERTDYDLELDHKESLSAGEALKIRLAECTVDPERKDFGNDLWRWLFGPFLSSDEEHPDREKLYKRYDNGSIFRTVDRIKLLFVILESERKLGGCNLELSSLLNDCKHPLCAVFPFHESKKLEKLSEKLIKWNSLHKLPLQDIRDYFGEQVALYFAFLQFYTRALIIPAVIGALTYFWQLGTGKRNIAFLPVYGVMISLWTTIFLESWKRYESLLRGKWGMSKFQMKEQPRPGFKGRWQPSLIDGSLEEFYPSHLKLAKCISSHSVIFTLIGIVIGLVSSIIIMRAWLHSTKGWSSNDASYLASFLTALGIQIMNFIYGKMATFLNEWENHKTDTEYENSKIAKVFLFKFVNSYYSLFYIAFLQKSGDRGCPDDDPNCMGLLQKQLGIIFVTQVVMNNIIEWGIPKLKQTLALRKHPNLLEASEAEIDYYFKCDYGSTLNDFDEITIQYGYVTLFVMALPITPLLALINNLIENVLDSHKLIHTFRRPEPRGAYNIGTWYSIFEIVGYLTIISNVAIITVFGDDDDSFFQNASTLTKFIVFIIIEHVLFLFKVSIAYFIPDEPYTETMRLQRQQYVVDILVRGADIEDSSDEDDQHMANKKKRKTMKGKPVGKWLKKHQMQQYTEIFKEKGYHNMRQIRQLNSDEIEKMFQEVGIEDEADKDTIRQNASGARKAKRREKRRSILFDKYNFEKIPSDVSSTKLQEPEGKIQID